MITPSPTTKMEIGVARGVLGAVTAPTLAKPGFITLNVPNTNYELHLLPVGEIKCEIGKRILGMIRAQARRIDVVETGGRYVEPVYGRPRRVQGTVVKITEDAVVVDAGVPIHCIPMDARQSPSKFDVGQFVSFDVFDGATFTQQ